MISLAADSDEISLISLFSIEVTRLGLKVN